MAWVFGPLPAAGSPTGATQAGFRALLGVRRMGAVAAGGPYTLSLGGALAPAGTLARSSVLLKAGANNPQ